MQNIGSIKKKVRPIIRPLCSNPYTFTNKRLTTMTQGSIQAFSPRFLAAFPPIRNIKQPTLEVKFEEVDLEDVDYISKEVPFFDCKKNIKSVHFFDEVIKGYWNKIYAAKAKMNAVENEVINFRDSLFDSITSNDIGKVWDMLMMLNGIILMDGCMKTGKFVPSQLFLKKIEQFPGNSENDLMVLIQRQVNRHGFIKLPSLEDVARKEELQNYLDCWQANIEIYRNDMLHMLMKMLEETEVFELCQQHIVNMCYTRNLACFRFKQAANYFKQDEMFKLKPKGYTLLREDNKCYQCQKIINIFPQNETVKIYWG